MKVFKILTFIGAAIGLLLILASLGAPGAAQQAAAAAVAVFLVAAPYCIQGVMFRDRFFEKPQNEAQPKNSSGVSSDAYRNWSNLNK
ncbi:hypothetical protein SAMN02927924_02818 [Sphingobium faniae]|nr:hypothetical protein SAMN02927924_02818 [Sphingobium faniae]